MMNSPYDFEELSNLPITKLISGLIFTNEFVFLKLN
jgi:hypothetical protein